MRRGLGRAIALVLVLASPAGAQYIGEVRLVEAKQLASSVLRALEQCVQSRGGGGASCTLADVASQVGLDPATGATGNRRWIVASSTLTLAPGATPARTGAITITGAAGRDTAGLALSLYVMPAGNTFRCEMRSGRPPDPTGGQPC